MSRFDLEELNKICIEYDNHYNRRETCQFWKPVMCELTGKLSHFNNCSHIVNRTHNCGHTLCPVPNF